MFLLIEWYLQPPHPHPRKTRRLTPDDWFCYLSCFTLHSIATYISKLCILLNSEISYFTYFFLHIMNVLKIFLINLHHFFSCGF